MNLLLLFIYHITFSTYYFTYYFNMSAVRKQLLLEGQEPIKQEPIKPKLNILSNEQNKVIELLKSKNNVICDSVAGSGKTTTILGIAQAFPKENICMLTYNARLKFETRARVKMLQLNNIEVNSYHSFCCKHYMNNTSTDEKIRMIIDDDMEPKEELKYTMLIIDEVQDMTPLYYHLVCKIAFDNEKGLRLVITGDTHQSIYSFMLADERFLINADKLFNFNSLPWVRTNLSTSYRTTKPIAEFLNKCILKEDKIVSVKDNDFKPRYLICNSYINPASYGFKSKTVEEKDLAVYEELLYYLNLGYKPEDIFIISPSTKENSPARSLINEIKKNQKTQRLLKDIKLFIPTSDNKKIDEDFIKDKLTFITYHQAKGLERKVCIVYGIDSGYFETFKQQEIDSVCPNEIYVALTRSLERLSVIHHNTKGYIQFIDKELLNEYCDIICADEKKKTMRQSNKRRLNTYELTDYTPELIISNVMKNIKIEITDGDKTCTLPTTMNKEYLPDTVIKNTIYHYYLYKKYHINKPLEYLLDLIPKNRKCFEYGEYERNGIIESVNNIIEMNDLSFKQFLKLSNMYYHCKNNLISNLNADIKYFDYDCNSIFDNLDKVFNFTEKKEFIKTDFMKNKNTNKIIDVNFSQEKKMQDIIEGFDIDSVLGDKKNDKINTKVNKVFDTSNCSVMKVEIFAHIDIVNENYYTFINMNKEITSEDIINACICSLMMNNMYKIKNCGVRIYNPVIDKIIVITYSNFDNCYSLLLLNRFIGFKTLTTNIFIRDNINIFEKYFG